MGNSVVADLSVVQFSYNYGTPYAFVHIYNKFYVLFLIVML